jgi:hypothetical protein
VEYPLDKTTTATVSGTVTAEQSDQTKLKSTAYQSDQANLKATAYQSDPANLKATAYQSDPANLKATVGAGVGPAAAATSVSITKRSYYTNVAPHGGGTQVTTPTPGGAGSDYWDLAANAEYELRCDPDWTGGAADSDVVRGVVKLGGAPGGNDDGWYLRTGERMQICVGAGTTLYVLGHNLGVAGRWTLRRVDG